MRKLLDNNLRNITISRTLVVFAGTLVSVFVPLLLLDSGISLVGVCLFYISYSVIKLFINYPAMLITNRWGAKVSLILSNFVQAAHLIALVFVVNGHTELVWLVAALLSLYNALSWNAYHLHVSRVMNNSRKGQDIATIESVGIFAGSIAPAVSAILTILISSSAPLLFAVFLLLVSNYWLKDIDSIGEGHKKTESLSYSLKHAPPRDIIANIFHNAHWIIGKEVWFIYLALTLTNVQSIATVATIAAMISAVFLIFVGVRNDKKGTHQVLREGSIAASLTHLLRLIPAGVITITFINTVWTFTSKYQKNPWTTTYYSHARGKGLNYIMSMEIGCDISYIVTFSLIFISIVTLGPNIAFPLLFIFGAVIALGTNLITPARDEA